jgi:predicted glycosyltransferase involved in capsule biosynthesis
VKFSVVIPYSENVYDVRDHRRQNFDYIVNRYKKLFRNAEIVIGKDNVGTQNAYCRSAAINDGVWKSSHELLVISDSDVIIKKDVLLEGLKLAALEEFVIPWGKCYDVSKATRKNIIMTKKVDWNKAQKNSKGVRDIRNDKLAGGLQIITKELYQKIEGYDERFVGWGYEDTNVCWKLQKELGDYTIFENEKILHLWHPRDQLNWNNRDLALKLKEQL